MTEAEQDLTETPEGVAEAADGKVADGEAGEQVVATPETTHENTGA